MSTNVRAFAEDRVQALKAEIVERLITGEPLAVMCRESHMPSATTVLGWQSADASFNEAYARARDAGYDRIAVNMRKVASGEPGYSSGDVQRDKLMVDTDLRLLKCWDPKRYGERLQHADADGAKLPDNSALVSELVGLLKPGAKPAGDKGE